MAALGSVWERGRARLLEASWSYVLGLVFFLACISVILSIGAEPGGVRAAVKPAVKAAILLLLVAKIMSGAYGGPERFRAAASRGESRTARVLALAPPMLIAWPRMERATFLACAAWLSRRPQPARPDGVAFHLLKKSAYSTFILIGLVSVCIELPMHTLIASVISEDPVSQQRIQLIFAVLGAYTLMWIFGDRYAMLASSHVIDGDVLDLKVGNRLSARLPLSAIVRCELVRESGAHWCKRHGIPEHTALTATPADWPNVMLVLDPGAGASVTSWQLERPAPQYLFLFVDEPAQMIAGLQKVAA